MVLAASSSTSALVDAISTGAIGPVLDLSYGKVVADLGKFEQICNALSASTNVYAVELAGCELSIEHAVLLARTLGANRGIQVLDLAGTALDDDALSELCNAVAKSSLLCRLSLHHNALGETSASTLSDVISSNKAIRNLQIGCNPFCEGQREPVDQALQTRPELNCDLIVDIKPEDRPVLEAPEKKWLTVPVRQRYAKCKPNQLDYYQCVASGNTARLGKLMKALGKEIDIAACHPEGFTAMHIAAANGHAKMLKELLKMGVPFDTKLPCDLGGHPRWYATPAGKMMRFALSRRSTPLFFAVAAGSIPCVKALLAAGDKASEPNANEIWPVDLASEPCRAELPVVDKEVAMKIEMERRVKAARSKSAAGKTKKKK